MKVRSDPTQAERSWNNATYPLPEGAGRPSSEGTEPLCWERVGETTRQYNVRRSAKLQGPAGGRRGEGASKSSTRKSEALMPVEFGRERNPLEILTYLFRSYFLPDGYPHSVTDSYIPYMRWRAVQYFFGGAMSVFTTRSLLHSLGIAKGAKAASGALAVNWVIKDGAGRLGKMMFARQGKKFDADLKQMRLASSMLLGLGAGLELSTVAAPHMFLPIACAANVLKNIGAVTNTSTRAPIYKAFARKENLGDITAKGESISNMADLMGTGFGILLARRQPSLQAAFWSLSLGYVIASYNEIRSVQLPTLNRSRFAVAVKHFLETGSVPGVPEVSRREHIVVPPWATERPMEVGARVADAFEGAEDFHMASEQCEGERFIVNFRPSKRKAYVVLRDGAGARDVLRGAFRAHLVVHHLRSQEGLVNGVREKLQHLQCPLLESSGTEVPEVGGQGRGERRVVDGDGGVQVPPYDIVLQQRQYYDCFSGSMEDGGWESAVAADAPLAMLKQSWYTQWLRRNAQERARQHALTVGDVRCALAASREGSRELFEDFISQASVKGWVIADSLLNPGEARLLSARPKVS